MKSTRAKRVKIEESIEKNKAALDQQGSERGLALVQNENFWND